MTTRTAIHAQRGVSLIELMIAMVLGLLLMGTSVLYGKLSPVLLRREPGREAGSEAMGTMERYSKVGMQELDQRLSKIVEAARKKPVSVYRYGAPWVWIVSQDDWQSALKELSSYVPPGHSLVMLRPQIEELLEFGTSAAADGEEFVDGGVQAVSSTDFRDSPKGMFTSPPKCFMHRQASFIPSFFPEGTKLDEDADFFYFPAYAGKPELGTPVLGAGTLVSITQT